MKQIIDKFTSQAIEREEDGATAEYYRRLREEKQFCSTKCKDCKHVSYPPRPFCTKCFSENIEWTPIGDGATLYAFTYQSKSLRFMKPDVIGIVDIPGVGRVLSKINAKYEDLKVGQKLKFEPFVISDKITVHSFTPAA
ncbi:MAG: zinc ribbon domain-containing protein [Bdellovibrionota bacterium]